MQYPSMAFIGAGNIASTIIAGLIKSGYPAKQIIASNPGQEKLTQLSSAFSIRTTQNNTDAASEADVIVLSVKPKMVKIVCCEIEESITDQLIISVAAGKTIATIKSYLQSDCPIVRAMPNTPCLLSKGAIGLYSESTVSQSHQQFVSRLFENIGEIIWLDNEQQIDIVTALSGSGPAYYFYLTEALIKAGIELGLDENVSSKLVNQTAIGAVAMLDSHPSQSANAHRKSVTSPHGTTEAAITVFDNQNLMQVIVNAVRAGTNRGTEMSKESD